MNDNTLNTLNVSNHPLILHKLSQLRDKTTPPHHFRQLVNELTLLLTYEVTQDFATATREIETPLESYQAPMLVNDNNIVIVSIMRAAIGMIDGLLTAFPAAKVGYIGLARNEETLQPEQYYLKFPANSANSSYIICDPMLATGGSVVETINQVKAVGASDIRVMTLLAAPEGVHKIHASHPEVVIYTAALDRALNENGYITPGLGDAGDRLYATF